MLHSLKRTIPITPEVSSPWFSTEEILLVDDTVPHEFGRQAPPLIKTSQQLKREIELLEALDDIEVAFSFLKSESNDRLNPVDQQYEQLKCKLRPIDPTEDVYQFIDKYLQSTHAATHQQYKMQIEDVFEVDRDHENESFQDLGNKMLLW